MNWKSKIIIISFSPIVFSCNNKTNHESPEKGSAIDTISDRTSEQLQQHQFSEPQSGAITQKINEIKQECLSLDFNADWTDVQEKNVWGSDGIGKVTYFFENDHLRKIRVNTESEKGTSKEMLYFIKNEELIMVKETFDEVYQPSMNMNYQNMVVSSDRYANFIDLTITTYFDHKRIISRSVEPKEKENKNVLDLDLEAKRLLKEFKFLVKEI